MEWSIESPKIGALRVALSGSLSVEDLQFYCDTLRMTYERIASVMLLGQLVSAEHRRNAELSDTNRQEWTWTALYYGYRTLTRTGESTVQRPFHEVVASIEPFITPIGVDAVRLESPGWLQVVGNMNPLKVIADFVTKWRAENTKRAINESRSASERERLHVEAALERERIQREFALEVLRHLPPEQRWDALGRLPEITSFAIMPVSRELKRIAVDSRLTGVELVAPGQALPEAGSSNTENAESEKRDQSDGPTRRIRFDE